MLDILGGIILTIVAYLTGHASGQARVKLILRNFIRTKQIEATHNSPTNYTMHMLDQILEKVHNI